jgi:hypothetical protein
MAATCPGCGKQTSEKKPTCYFCGTFLLPPVKCGKCAHMVPPNRATCQYCGAAIEKTAPDAAAIAAAPPPKSTGDPRSYRNAEVTPAPSRPAALVAPKLDLEDRSSGATGWLRQYETQIDLLLFALALPIALLSMATSFVFSMLARMRGRG